MKQCRSGVVAHHVRVTVCWVPEVQHQHAVDADDAPEICLTRGHRFLTKRQVLQQITTCGDRHATCCLSRSPSAVTYCSKSSLLDEERPRLFLMFTTALVSPPPHDFFGQ